MSKRTPRKLLTTGSMLVPLVVLGFAPRSATRWVDWFSGPIDTLTAPLSGPTRAMAGALRGATDTLNPNDELTREQLVKLVNEYEHAYERQRARIVELEAVVRDLQGGVAFPGATQATPIGAEVVVADPPRFLRVNKGKVHGVRAAGAVATARGSQQLIGVVSSASSSVSTIRLITDPRGPQMLGVVTPGNALDTGASRARVRVQLEPDGHGLLVSDQVGRNDAASIQVGDLVRLNDNTWPSSAAMYVLGRVVVVEPLASDPLFSKVVVQPLVEDLTRVGSVILRVPRDAASEQDEREGASQ